MPALLTSTSTRPNAETALSMPAWTSVSLVTSIATPIASSRPSSAAVASALGLVEVGDGDLGAFAAKGARDFLADAAGGAGDNGNFAYEAHASLLSVVRVAGVRI